MKTPFMLLLLTGAILSCETESQCANNPDKGPSLPSADTEVVRDTIDLSKWDLVWEDNFDYENERLDENWESQNGPSGHILCSRWRENAVVADGMLQLVNRKERRGGQEWTSGNIWTRRKFTYGYFECRYRYAAATGTNNSFWLMTRGPDAAKGKRFEIDINEGHYPNEVNTNIHNWGDITTGSDGRKTHPSFHKSFSYGGRPDYSLPLEMPVSTRRIRLISNNSAHFHIREVRIYNVTGKCYPNPLSEAADQDVQGLVNFARDDDTRITCSGLYNAATKPENVVDGRISTSWITQKQGEKWIEFEWPTEKTIGCIQFINGWQEKGTWRCLINDYKLQCHDGRRWIDISTFDVEKEMNFGREFHTYGLEWNVGEIVFYIDGREIRREKNEFCFSEVPIWLSLAIISWSGQITDAIDGTSMKIDWVRYYQPKAK